MRNLINTKLTIGVFYKDSAWKDEVFESLALSLEKKDICRISKDSFVLYRENVIIHFIPADNENEDYCRAYRFDRVYYQEGISDNFLKIRVRSRMYPQIFPLFSID